MQTNEVSVKPAVRCPRCERGYQIAELQPDDMVVFDGPGAFKSVEYVQPVLDQDFDTRNTHRKPMNDWIHPKTQMPPLETEVLLVVRGKIRKGVRLIDEPTWEETYAPYHYWDDPDNDGQDWGDEDVTGWMHLPGVPE